MTRTDDIAGVVDGRQARRQRNIDAVLDVVLAVSYTHLTLPTILRV